MEEKLPKSSLRNDPHEHLTLLEHFPMTQANFNRANLELIHITFIKHFHMTHLHMTH